MGILFLLISIILGSLLLTLEISLGTLKLLSIFRRLTLAALILFGQFGAGILGRASPSSHGSHHVCLALGLFLHLGCQALHRSLVRATDTESGTITIHLYRGSHRLGIGSHNSLRGSCRDKDALVKTDLRVEIIKIIDEGSRIDGVKAR